MLDGGDNLVTLTNGTSDGDIALGAITDDASGASAADLTITSSGNVTLGTVSLNDVTDGDLIITVDSDDADGEAETLTLGGAITDVALITLNGGYSADSDDIIEINADLTTGGAITIADADSVNIDALAAGTITSGGAITITSNIDGILLDGGDNLVTLSSGNDGNIGLANIADDASGGTAASLSISSEGGLSLGTISLNDTTNGALSLTVDSDNADAESETLSVTGISNVGALTLSGGYSSNSDDIIDIGADLTTTGSIVIQNADSVNIDASAARTITSGGAITITSNIEGILLDGGSNLVTLTNGTSDGDIDFGAITDDGAGATAADLTITSSGNVTLGTVSLNDVDRWRLDHQPWTATMLTGKQRL